MAGNGLMVECPYSHTQLNNEELFRDSKNTIWKGCVVREGGVKERRRIGPAQSKFGQRRGEIRAWISPTRSRRTNKTVKSTSVAFIGSVHAAG